MLIEFFPTFRQKHSFCSYFGEMWLKVKVPGMVPSCECVCKYVLQKFRKIHKRKKKGEAFQMSKWIPFPLNHS